MKQTKTRTDFGSLTDADLKLLLEAVALLVDKRRRDLAECRIEHEINVLRKEELEDKERLFGEHEAWDGSLYAAELQYLNDLVSGFCEKSLQADLQQALAQQRAINHELDWVRKAK